MASTNERSDAAAGEGTSLTTAAQSTDMTSPSHGSLAPTLQPPSRSLVPYVLLNMVTGVTFPLFEGRNLIGRSLSPIHDVFFVNLESPRSAISRIHAEIIVAPNGDVWVSDANSTNGTHIAVRGGPGIALGAEKYYYCVGGTRMLFGDVELTLVIDDTLIGESQLGAALGLPQGGADGSAPPSNVMSSYFARILSQSPGGVASSLPPIPRTLSDLPAGFVTRARSRSMSRRSSSQPRSRTSKGEEESEIEQPPVKVNFPFAGSADRMVAQLLNAGSSIASAGDHVPPSLPAENVASRDDNAAVVGIHPSSEGRLSGDPQRSSAGSNRSLIPYLDDEDVRALPPPVVEGRVAKASATGRREASPAAAPAKPSTTVARERKQGRANCVEEPEVPAKKGARTEKAAPPSIHAPAAPVTVCLSGFDSKEKDVLTRLVKSRKGSVVDSMSAKNVDVLVVREPPTRTPKFLISMGRGRPIVTSRFLEDAAPLSRAYEYLPDLLHNGVRYTGKKMQQVLQNIHTSSDAAIKAEGVLSGRSFFVSDTVGAAKQVLVEVIKGCGGQISRKKNDDDVDLVTDADEVYRKLLTGEYTRK
jgi:hypothetical protein